MTAITTLPEAEARVAAARKTLGTPVTKRELRCWNALIAIEEDIAPVLPPVVIPPPVVVPPTLTPMQPVKIGDGKSHSFNGVHIKNLSATTNGGYAISCISGDVITFRGSIIEAVNYAAWLECNEVNAEDTLFITHSGGNDYPVRAYPAVKWRSTRCTYDNTEGKVKAAFRAMQCTDFISDGDTFKGGRLMSGGGVENEWDNEQPAVRVYRNGFIACESVEVYDKSHSTFENMDFAGTGHIFVDDGGTLILKNCRNVPTIKRKSTTGTTVSIT